MGGDGSVTIIDPPVGAALRQPALAVNETPGTGVVQVSIEARRAPINVNGTTANLVTYNGQLPGPLIRVHNDELLRLNFRNGLPDDGQLNFLGHPMWTTNIHTHGLHVTPDINMNGTYGDYMLAMANPGETLTYEYDLTRHPAGNLNFYHPHIHGSVTDQMWGGLSAPLVVEDAGAAAAVLAPFAEQVLVLKDISLSGSEPAPHTSRMQYMHGLEGNIVMVNGQVNPRLTIVPGEVQRWRIVNACTARFFRLSLQGHVMHVVGTDGGLLDKPYPVTELLLSPGERADLLVKADQATASYRWLSLPYSRGGMSALQQVTLMTLTYQAPRRKSALPAPMAIPPVVDASARRMTAADTGMDFGMLPQRRLALTMGMGAVGIDGITYVDHEHCYMTMSDLGTWEVWEVVNESGMDHPFHHHTNSAQVLSINGGNAGYASLYTSAPAWKDVTIVPARGSVRLLMPVMDYAGMAMIHCHIIEHEDIGMMGIWHIMGGMGDM
ncbi:MAG: copper oxidase, partial [Chloroflexi bacterium RBG_16_72_14]